MRNVVVTGGSGKAGRSVIQDLIANGHTVIAVDVAPPREQLCHFMRADLADYGETVECLKMAAGIVDRRRSGLGQTWAVIHLAGIPAPGLAPDAATFRNNMISTYNVFTAATALGLERVVWASSETTYGLPFTRNPPTFAPVTEEHPLVPETSYALAKTLCEEMARDMSRWNPGTRFTALRISNIFEEGDYSTIPSFWEDPALRRWNLWSWVDARDVAQACRLALTADLPGADVFTVAAADTLMTTPSRALMAASYPDVPIRGDLGEFKTLLSIEKARRMLGYAPAHTWRTSLAPA